MANFFTTRFFYYFDVGNVLLIQQSFEDNFARSSYKACAELHTIYRRTNNENGLTAYFEVMRTCHSVTYLFMPNQSKEINYQAFSR